MALTVGTDSFTALADADTYFDGRLYASDWTGATSTDKEKALRMATAMLNRERWAGSLASASQLLAWPRVGATDAEGRPVAFDATPEAVKAATCELAVALLRNDLTTNDAMLGVRRQKQKVGEIERETEYDGRAPARRLPDYVAALIAPFLSSQTTPLSVRMVP